MSDLEQQRINQDVDRRLREIDRIAANLPVRWKAGGGGSLPQGTGRFKVLQIVDDQDPGTLGFDYVRLIDTPS